MGEEKVSQNNLIVAGHQPNFFPWFGYFEKMLQADIFVFSDDVQYTKQNYVNRVVYPSEYEGTLNYLTLPVKKGNDGSIAEKRYVKDPKTLKTIVKTIRYNFGGLSYSSDLEPLIELFIKDFWRFETVADLNVATNINIARRMHINTTVIRGNDVGLSQWSSNERLIKRQQLLNSRIYLSGAGASGYMIEDAFIQHGIELRKICYSLGPQLFGASVKFSVLFGIASIGLETIRQEVKKFKLRSRFENTLR